MISKTIHILTMFPSYFDAFKDVGVVGKVLRKERNIEINIDINIISISDFCHKGFKGVDAAPYGGGPGMVMRADVLEEVLFKAVLAPNNLLEMVQEDDYNKKENKKFKIICPMPRGKKWDHERAKSFSEENFLSNDFEHIIFICGRYEGIDERFIQRYVQESFSIGDFVLSGGEIPVMAFLDSSLRLIEGTLLNKDSLIQESFSNNLLENELYTRPQVFRKMMVPEVYLSGHDKNIKAQKEIDSLKMTKDHRPDLLTKKENLNE